MIVTGPQIEKSAVLIAVNDFGHFKVVNTALYNSLFLDFLVPIKRKVSTLFRGIASLGSTNNIVFAARLVDHDHATAYHQFAHGNQQQVVEHKIHILRLDKHARSLKQGFKLKSGMAFVVLRGRATQNVTFFWSSE